ACKPERRVRVQSVERGKQLRALSLALTRFQRNGMERDEQVVHTEVCAQGLFERTALKELPATEVIEARTADNVDALRIFAELAHTSRRLLVRHEVHVRHLRDRVSDRFVERPFSSIPA